MTETIATEPIAETASRNSDAAGARTDSPTLPAPVPAAKRDGLGIQKRVKAWIKTLHRDPSEEARANAERRARLLEEINRAVIDAPDDIPIKDLVARLNRHNDD